MNLREVGKIIRWLENGERVIENQDSTCQYDYRLISGSIIMSNRNMGLEGINVIKDEMFLSQLVDKEFNNFTV